MPVYSEDHPIPSSAPPLLRQVLDWIGPADHSKSKPGEEAEFVTNRVFHLLQEEEEEDGRRMASSAALASVLPPAAKCPYSAVAKNPAVPYVFQMPLHYPRYTKVEYEKMPEWQLDRLFEEYGLSALISESLRDKRDYAIGAFIWK